MQWTEVAGQYSTGKTTFIRALLEGREYPGMHIAAEMSTDNFIAVMRGQTDDIIPGESCQTIGLFTKALINYRKCTRQ